MKPEDFREGMLVKLAKSGFCSNNTGKILNTSMQAKSNPTDFPGWSAFNTVLDACQSYPDYFEIVDSVVINDYSIY